MLFQRERFASTAACGLLLLVASTPGLIVAQQPARENGTPVSLAGGRLQLRAPADWKKIEPRFSMIESEFALPKQGDDEKDARLTIMSAGGSIDANIERWIGQFSQPDGTATSDHAKVDQEEVAGMTVHRVDISGTFADRPRPAAPAVERANYRMLAAIIETPGQGTYFVKLYGARATIDHFAKSFDGFVKSLKAN